MTTTPDTMATTVSLGNALAYAVCAGGSIPAHDEAFDIADRIATDLEAFRAYVASVRDEAQAGEALEELADAIKSAAYDVRVASRVRS